MFGHPNRGPAGHVVITSPSGGTAERETRRCAHCGKHWLQVPGSGRQRGLCLRCHGLTCGAKPCDPCLPYEVRIEIEEGRRSGTVAAYLDTYRAVFGALPG